MLDKIGLWLGLALLTGVSAIPAIVLLRTGWPARYYLAAGALTLGALVVRMVYRRGIGPMLRAAHLQEHGRAAEARIRALTYTGERVNRERLAQLQLDVVNADGSTSPVSLQAAIPRHAEYLYHPGAAVPVLIDPADATRLVLDHGRLLISSGPPAPPYLPAAPTLPPVIEPAAVEREIRQLFDLTEDIRAWGAAAPATVRAVRWLGCYVNGDNPYAELDLLVEPRGGAPFEATVRAVLGGAALARYQLGQAVRVHYDEAGRRRVTLDQG